MQTYTFLTTQKRVETPFQRVVKFIGLDRPRSEQIHFSPFQLFTFQMPYQILDLFDLPYVLPPHTIKSLDNQDIKPSVWPSRPHSKEKYFTFHCMV